MRALAVAACLVILSACHTGSGSQAAPFPTATPSGPLLYVADAANNSIFIFARNATGVALPQTTISGVATTLIHPYPIAADSSGNIWVASHGPAPVLLEFGPSAVGNAAPLITMTISSPSTPGTLPVNGLAFDASGKVYVATGPTNHVMVFSGGATGAPAPIQDISGVSTQLNDAEGIALDSSGNIYTASRGSNAILEFAAGATGNVAPIRTIQGFFSTQLSSPVYVALDANGDIFALNSTSGIITEYGAGSRGDVAPIASFSRPGMGNQIAFDAAGNLDVASLNTNPGSVLVYSPPITSTSAPVQMLSSPVLSSPTGVFAR